MRIGVFYIALIFLAGCGKPQAENKRGSSLSSSTPSKTNQVDGELTTLPTPKYKTYDLCEGLSSFASESVATKEAITDLCEARLLSDLRKSPYLYDGSSIPQIYEKLEVTDDTETNLTWYESMLVNTTATQFIELLRLRLTKPQTYAANFSTSSDINLSHISTQGDKSVVSWESNRIAYLPQAFEAEVSLQTLAEDQTYVLEWSLSTAKQATKTYSKLVIVNQIGLNRSEVLTYIDTSSEHGGDANIFLARTFDTRQEIMKLLRNNAVSAYKAKDMLP